MTECNVDIARVAIWLTAEPTAMNRVVDLTDSESERDSPRRTIVDCGLQTKLHCTLIFVGRVGWIYMEGCGSMGWQ